MIKIEAAQRLKVMAAVDEEQMRGYLKSLGVDPKRVLWKNDADPTSKIWKGQSVAFEIADPADALDKISKHLGAPKPQTRLGIKQWTFKVSREYQVRVSEAGFTRLPAFVSVLDTTRNYGRDDSKMH